MLPKGMKAETNWTKDNGQTERNVRLDPGVTKHARSWKDIAERIRATATGLLQRLNEWENAFVQLRKMFSLVQRDNAMLNGRVMQLSQQVQHLSERTERLNRIIQREQEIRDERR